MTKTRRSIPIVLGASMAGLGAARALTNRFERVTVIERDDLSDNPSLKRGPAGGARARSPRERPSWMPRRAFPRYAERAGHGDRPAGR